MAMPDHARDVVDPSLLNEKVNADAADDRCGDDIRERPSTSYQDGYPVQARRLEECLVSAMQLGLSCSAISPTERMLMNVVVNQMKAIRDSYHKLRRQS
ncbi:Leucine-rich repeat protein kinase family protein [Prunus dulcis]|uniref:Leucine-rich repeat protein kinase family protein n=1 Tax=Prunus dulcis TaxID=3755 RepID=A0A4Y1QLT1_PRUDU|nr:Leucine-rich repeat protein kinase family protein [Prunus dulcis]